MKIKKRSIFFEESEKYLKDCRFKKLMILKKDKNLDKKNYRILQMLDANVRVSIATIAQQVRLTENAIRYRIKRLKEKGCIKGYSLRLSSSRLGKNIQVIFSINVKPESLASSLKKLAHYSEFTKVYRCSGEYSIVCVGFFNDNEQLDDFLNKKMFLDIPVINWAEHIILKRYKNEEFGIKMI